MSDPSDVVALEQRRRLDAAQQVFPVVSRFERPNVGQRAAVVFGKGRSRLRLLERFPEVGRAQDLQAEEGIATRSVNSRCAARVDQRGVNRHARTKRAAQREAAPGLRRLGHEQSFLGANAEQNTICHS